MKRDDLESLLPAIYRTAVRSSRVYGGLLDVMEQLHTPAERVLDTLPATFDPRTAPAPVLAYLARWVGLDWVRPSAAAGGAAGDAVAGQRELVARSSALTRRRGTAAGLLRLLRVSTGRTGFHVVERPEDVATGRAFHFRVVAPASTRGDELLVRRIIEREKPAHLTYDLRFDERDPEGD